MAKRSPKEQIQKGILPPEIRDLAMAEAGQAEKEAGWFRTTRWSLVRASREPESSAGGEALDLLCRAYWQPVCNYIMGKGVDPAGAADITQDFFVKFLSLNSLNAADPEKGRFRALILASVNHHLHNHWRAQRAAKRGGGEIHMEIAALETADEPGVSDDKTDFDRAWAKHVVALAYTGLQEEYEGSGRGEIFKKMSYLLLEDEEMPVDLGPALKMSQGGLKVALHRMRRRFGLHLVRQVEETLSEGDSVTEELRYLLSLLDRDSFQETAKKS